MPVCKACGKDISRRVYPNGLCQGCYKYFLSGGTVNKLPAIGIIEYDERGCVVCHICGRAYARLGSHIKESHGMTTSEYKEKFGLCKCCKTTEAQYSQKMRQHAYNNKMPERLIQTGAKTRIKPGDKIRLGKQVRLQECLDRSRRYRYGNKSDVL